MGKVPGTGVSTKEVIGGGGTDNEGQAKVDPSGTVGTEER